ncbi:molecular chaperone [Aquisalimonas sp.]|uniref:TorD/DmsD family molecular chaperone n=1 Tax=unclassified Aquisalimonas TaxID=2644645 RepID=UPI0025C59BE7|nr:molecular chaperone TorD family protein [Aquisalimonas sp.]
MSTTDWSVPSAAAATREDELRAGTWTLLGRLLAAPPDREVIDLLRGISRGSGQRESDALATAWQELRKAAGQVGMDAVDREFHDLFIGVGGGEITPYASWYQTGSLMERPLVVLRQDLQQLGVERQEGNSEPEDHAAAICDVMALIISDPDVSFEWQRELFQKHVEPWMEAFFRDVEQSENADFYRAVGQVGAAFVALEQDYFSMLA